MPRKKRETMLQRQRRLLQMQRARKAASKQLPPKGETKAGSVKARVQRATTAGKRRDAVARKNLETVAKGVKRMIRQSSAQNKLDKAAKGTKGSGTRTGQVGKGKIVRSPGGKVTTKGGAIVKSSKGNPANGRIERVKVRVEPQKQLPPAKPSKAGSGSSSKGRLPPGKTRPAGKPSARRAQAAAKAARAAQGTTGGTRVGQPAGAANRMYGANTVNKAVSRAVTSTAARNALKTVGRLLAGRDDGSGSALLAAKMTSDAIDAVRGSTAKERNAKKKKPKSQAPKPTNKRSRQENRRSKTAKRGLSNIPPQEGTGRGSPNDKPKAKNPPKPPTTPARTAPTKPTVKKPQSARERAYAKDARNKEYDRLRKAGKTKEAEALGKKIAADTAKKAPKNPYRAPQGSERKDTMSKQVKELKEMRKKMKKLMPNQSAAIRAGYPGNLNY